MSIKRTPVLPDAAKIINAKAPHYLKGIQPKSVEDHLKNATKEQVEVLTKMNFALWSATSGLEVDQRKFEFDSHRYLLPIYLDDSKEIVWRKAAQLGATIYMLLRMLWFCRTHAIKAGMFFPNESMSTMLSKDRLGPIIESNPELDAAMTNTDSMSLKQIQNIHDRMSSLYMLYLGGRSSKDSVPLDIIGFDEVRLCDPADVDQALERISHSSYKYKMFLSTVGHPNTDIDARFIKGNQLTWTWQCNCVSGVVLEDHWPNCVVEHKGEVYLRCPVCKYKINDRQNGRYIENNPGADYNSYCVSQLASNYISVKEIWDAYKRTTNMKEFYNAKLGRPYIDAENQPIDQGVMDRSVKEDIHWAYGSVRTKKKKRMRGMAMGVDQHSGNCYVQIGRIAPNGEKELVHLEVIDTANPRYWEKGKPVTPFKRLYELMREFDIQFCICDAMPNANEATQFARDFKGRVFLSYYKDAGEDIVRWHDKPGYKPNIKKGSHKQKFKHMVFINRYLGLDFYLKEWQDRAWRMPAPGQLVQALRDPQTGRFVQSPPAEELGKHLKAMVRQKNTMGEENEGRFKMIWVHIGPDHFTHAGVYLTMSLERIRNSTKFVF